MAWGFVQLLPKTELKNMTNNDYFQTGGRYKNVIYIYGYLYKYVSV